jgi:hypothetical protein
MEVSDSHSVNAGWGYRGPGAEQRDEVGMSQQCGSRRVRGRAEVVGPVAGAPGERDLTEDEFDQAVEQRGLVRDVPVDRHRVDAGARRGHIHRPAAHLLERATGIEPA